MKTIISFFLGILSIFGHATSTPPIAQHISTSTTSHTIIQVAQSSAPKIVETPTTQSSAKSSGVTSDQIKANYNNYLGQQTQTPQPPVVSPIPISEHSIAIQSTQSICQNGYTYSSTSGCVLPTESPAELGVASPIIQEEQLIEGQIAPLQHDIDQLTPSVNVCTSNTQAMEMDGASCGAYGSELANDMSYMNILTTEETTFQGEALQSVNDAVLQTQSQIASANQQIYSLKKQYYYNYEADEYSRAGDAGILGANELTASTNQELDGLNSQVQSLQQKLQLELQQVGLNNQSN